MISFGNATLNEIIANKTQIHLITRHNDKNQTEKNPTV